MRPKKEENEKRIKVSITLSPQINKKMEEQLTNKSKLIEKLLFEFYDKKSM